MKSQPLTELADEAAHAAGCLRSDGRARCRGGARLRGSVLLHHHLDALMLITASLQKILVRLVDLVLVQFELRGGEIELVLQAAFLRICGLSNSRGQPRHARLVALELLL